MSEGVDVRDASAAFVEKWRVRWPEWGVAQVFVPVAQRVAWTAWFALVDELVDAAWAAEDPRPGEAKLGWWAQELQGWATGARRHPLARALPLGQPAWAGLAAALPGFATARHAADADALQGVVAPVAHALAQVDAMLVGHVPSATASIAGASGWTHWLMARRIHAPGADTRAEAAPHADVAWPAVDAGPRAAILWRALLRARLARRTPAHPLPVLVALATAWRAARNAPVH